ncbi:head GIN domain-containing protein [Fulvivirga ligni]|uniref:head GIN domain-containing protein n=1 Tax=Fulvivirga ligni TaxID=2904246 RepID=UPI001F181119|nr:head GIN domain-containing protein [Fulvivirga ligni]UII23248.1 DUF2807 domain-containing protein [Fulvivirga ligni]
MRKVLFNILTFVAILSLFAQCDNDSAPDCLKKAGNTTTVELEVDAFEKIEITNSLNVFIKQASEQRVELTVGSNLINDIAYSVDEGGVLYLTNNLGCKWVRSYGFPEVTIYTPDINNIINNGDGTVSSIDTLKLDRLSVSCEDRSGDFDLTIETNYFGVVTNSLSNFRVDGLTDEFRIFFAAGDGRFEGENLKTRNANVTNRGSNDIIVNVSDTLTGSILSSGNIILRGSRPKLIEIEDRNLGELIDQTQ